MSKSLLSLYEEHIYYQDTQNNFSTELWDKLPRKLGDLGNIINEKIQRREAINSETFSELRKIIQSNFKEFGLFNSQIKDKLDSWNPQDPTFEIGHQPLFFGGSSFVFNKISYAIGLSQYLESQHNLKSFPFLFIGDHDQVQNELTITRFPQFQSFTGLELKFDYDEKYESTPMAHLPLYPEEVLLDQLDKVRSNYRELFRFAKIKNEFRPLLEERLELSFDVLYESFLSSKTFSDWITKFWAKMFILVNKAPIFILKASDDRLRKLMLPYLEELLQEENRTQFFNTINSYHEKITQAGFKPGLSIRELDEVPFFYECPHCIYKSRIKLEKVNSSLEGKCPTCGEKISIDYNENNPDLSDHYQYLSPRVESRSVVINRLLKSVMRITGGGETTYHAQIIPFMRKMNYLTPVVMKNPRIYYNTPWAEKISNEISFEDLKPLQNSETFKLMSRTAKANNFDDLKSCIIETKQLLDENLKSFQAKEESLTNILQKGKNKKILKQLDQIQLYLSHNFGTFQNGKTIQEVSWNWIDLSILTGLKDLYGFYSRRLKPELPLSPTFWLTIGRYN